MPLKSKSKIKKLVRDFKKLPKTDKALALGILGVGTAAGGPLFLGTVGATAAGVAISELSRKKRKPSMKQLKALNRGRMKLKKSRRKRS